MVNHQLPLAIFVLELFGSHYAKRINGEHVFQSFAADETNDDDS